jgi:hypothetical protein
MSGAFLLKVLVGLLFLNFHSEYLGPGQTSGDAELFIFESQFLTNVFYTSPIDYFKFLFGLEDEKMVMDYLSETTYWAGDPTVILNDSKNVLKIHSIINFYSFSFPPINLISCTFFSVFGIYHLFKAIRDWVVIDERILFLAILLLPSVLFWTSGVMKESFLFLGIGLFCRGLLAEDSLQKKSAYFVFGALFLIGFKPYVFVAVLLSMLVYFFIRLFKNRYLALGFFILAIAISNVFFISMKVNKITTTISAKQFDFIGISKGAYYFRNDSCFFNLNPEQMNYMELKKDGYFLTRPIPVEYHFPYQKVAPHKIIAQPNITPWKLAQSVQQCGSYIPITYIDNSSIQLLKNIPEALKNVLFRPFMSDQGGRFTYLAVLEVFLLYLFLLFAILRRRKLNHSTFALLVTLCTFIILLSLIIGWVTPVLGAIVRYRFPVYLAILVVGLVIMKPITFNKKEI